MPKEDGCALFHPLRKIFQPAPQEKPPLITPGRKPEGDRLPDVASSRSLPQQFLLSHAAFFCDQETSARRR